MNHYDKALQALEAADSKDEVYEAYKQYDATEGGIIRHREAVRQKIEELELERIELLKELNDSGAPASFHLQPIKEIAAVKLFDMIYRPGE